MNHLKLNNQFIDKTVIRPSVSKAIHQLFNSLNVNKDIRVKVDDKTEDSMSKLDEDLAAITSEDWVDVDYVCEYEESGVMSGNYVQLTNPIIFDNELDFMVTPLYTNSVVTNTVRYEAKSRTNVNDLRMNLLNSLVNRDAICIHDIDYKYYIPQPVIKLVHEILRCKNLSRDENNAILFKDYLTSICEDNLMTSVTINGDVNNYRLVAKDIQTEVIGIHKTDLRTLKPEYDKDDKVWFIEFEYEFRMSVPVQFFLQYPSMVYNTLLHRDYVVSTEYKDNYNSSSYGFLNPMDYVTKNLRVDEPNYYLNIPKRDRKILPITGSGYVKIFSVLVKINNDDLRSLFNLVTDFRNIGLKEKVVNFISDTEYTVITKPFKSVFLLQLFEGDRLVTGEDLELDSDLNVYALRDLDISKEYRVVLSITNDTTLLANGVIERAEKADMVNNIIEFLNIDPELVYDRSRQKTTGSISFKRSFNRIVEYRSCILAKLMYDLESNVRR